VEGFPDIVEKGEREKERCLRDKVLLITNLLKKKRFGEASTSFYNFTVAFFDKICDQGSCYTTWRPTSNVDYR